MLRHDAVGIGGGGEGGRGWFLESLRAVCPTCPPCSQALRSPCTTELSLVGCHSRGCKVTHCIRLQFGVHQPHRHLSPRSSLLMSLNSGNVRFGGFPFASHRSMGFFFIVFLLRSGHYNRVSLPVVARAFSLFSAAHPSPHSEYMVNM